MNFLPVRRLGAEVSPSSLLYLLARYRVPLVLFLLALLTRLPLLSSSIDEVDAANFVNALTMGYDVPLLRPHPPGYPVYIFMGWLIDGVFNSPRFSLTLLSALLGSLSVLPFYSLLREMAGKYLAVIGTLLFIVNPLFWTFSEAALSDVPSMFFTVVLAWLAFKARFNGPAFLAACLVCSLAIGVRQANISLVLLLLFPLGYRMIVLRQLPWSLTARGAEVFILTTAVWALTMIAVGSAGFGDYSEAVQKQWETSVRVYDYSQVESPWLINLLFRFERFFYGYFLTYLWTGDDAKTPFTLLLITPWILGFGLFVTGFSFRRSEHVLIALWVLSIGYTILAIHFLPRYGLAQMSGFMLACLMGFQVAGAILKHPRKLEIAGALGIGTLMVLYGIKYQPPVNTFEFTPPEGSYSAGAILTLGILFFAVANFLYHRPSGVLSERQISEVTDENCRSNQVPFFVLAALVVLLVPFSWQGYRLASIAHETANPSQRLVEFVRDRYPASHITPCWDNQTHSFFDVLIPEAIPTGYWSIDDLYVAESSGKTLIVTDNCVWFEEIRDTLGLVELAQFGGDSPLWSKTPTLVLYATKLPPE